MSSAPDSAAMQFFRSVAKKQLDPTDRVYLSGNAVCGFKFGPAVVGGVEDFCSESSEPQVCPEPSCGEELSSLGEMEIHYSGLHSGCCQQCGRSFPSAHLLELHLDEVHASHFLLASKDRTRTVRTNTFTHPARIQTPQPGTLPPSAVAS